MVEEVWELKINEMRRQKNPMVSILSLCRFPTLFLSVILHVCAFQIFLENLSLFKTIALRYAGAYVCVCVYVCMCVYAYA